MKGENRKDVHRVVRIHDGGEKAKKESAEEGRYINAPKN